MGGLGFFHRFFLSPPSPHCFYLTVNELPRPFFLDLVIGRPANFAVHRHIAFCNLIANPPFPLPQNNAIDFDELSIHDIYDIQELINK